MTNVDRILQHIFAGAREPRSTAYKEGVRAALAHEIDAIPVRCPFAAGTAEFDAFFAGVDEGRLESYRAEVLAA